VWESNGVSASAEGDDAANRIVRRDANRHAIPRHHFDSKAAHPAAELCQHFVSLVALHAIQPAAMDRHDRALHVNQIILAQLLSFPIKEYATSGRRMQTLCSLTRRSCGARLQTCLRPCSERANRGFNASRKFGVIVAVQ